ncbi:MAG TPA: DUF3500 domain-containing protein [Planctomycetota bacterium]|nr:DUF3500 domain-containing protein [Planctomycetota bacterium]
MSPRCVRTILGVLASASALFAAHTAYIEEPADVVAARAFLAALEPAQREHATFDLDAPERLDWHFVPRARPGVRLDALSGEADAAFDALLASALTAQGVGRVEFVVELERILRERESRPERPATWRDPGAYVVVVFGEPHTREPWGWRLEGHHLSLTFTRVGDALAVTPAFLGANPARVSSDTDLDLRLLGAEEDLARELVRSLDAEQLALALADERAPADIAYTPERRERLAATTGIAGAQLDDAQRALLERLLDTWLASWHPATAAAARERLGPVEGLRLTWMGGLGPGEPHYWRIDGAHAVVEWDDVQDGANHVHCVWRDLERDHGRDLLAEHRRGAHGEPLSDD